MMVDLAQHYDEGPVSINDIARRQDISPKYLEQLIIPLKKKKHIKSVRGPKGGHMLARPPEEITVGEIVRTLEGETGLVHCIENPASCNRVAFCPTYDIWKSATEAMFNKLNGITLFEIVRKDKNP
jgi:Rrf2 family protein